MSLAQATWVGWEVVGADRHFERYHLFLVTIPERRQILTLDQDLVRAVVAGDVRTSVLFEKDQPSVDRADIGMVSEYRCRTKQKLILVRLDPASFPIPHGSFVVLDLQHVNDSTAPRLHHLVEKFAGFEVVGERQLLLGTQIVLTFASMQFVDPPLPVTQMMRQSLLKLNGFREDVVNLAAFAALVGVIRDILGDVAVVVQFRTSVEIVYRRERPTEWLRHRVDDLYQDPNPVKWIM